MTRVLFLREKQTLFFKTFDSLARSGYLVVATGTDARDGSASLFMCQDLTHSGTVRPLGTVPISPPMRSIGSRPPAAISF